MREPMISLRPSVGPQGAILHRGGRRGSASRSRKGTRHQAVTPTTFGSAGASSGLPGVLKGFNGWFEDNFVGTPSSTMSTASAVVAASTLPACGKCGSADFPVSDAAWDGSAVARRRQAQQPQTKPSQSRAESSTYVGFAGQSDRSRRSPSHSISAESTPAAAAHWMSVGMSPM